MSQRDFESEYNNSLRVPGFADIEARWQAASETERARTNRATLDQRYGEGERERYDLFASVAPGAPLVVYLHGGYWQSGDRTLYAWVAGALSAAGCTVAIPSYPLCPAVSVLDIVAALRRCLSALWRATGARPVLVGHSAGGHLVAAMLATDWAAVDGVPDDLVNAGLAISGVFELEPLVGTSINDALGLDAAAARAASPRWWRPPPPDRRLIAAVGGQESAEFRRQSRELSGAWATVGVNTRYLEVPGANHFTVIDELAIPGSALQGAVLELANR
ncbi:MAG: arylformamidase [Solirubrobacteraceae bacterium]|nr:arylformamidase [Solirubrobacteraceae bacterium]